eukprot:GFUD01051999.1.p1 GENE.GFUD01051999.1~~GFUD01051999.1.p1  ORF type:complete len:336 (+),score=78.87 GFUD01051999.1:75-1082(+)
MDDNLGTIEEEMENLEVSTDSDSGVDESTQGRNGMVPSRRPISRIPMKTQTPSTPQRSRHKMAADIIRSPRSKSVPASIRPPFAPFSCAPSTPSSVKKVPMNKVVVGVSPSPNLRSTQSRIGSLSNTKHKPGGGQVKIEHRKLEWNAASRTKALNAGYVPGGGDIKIEQRKLNWNVASKVGSLEKTSHRPGGGQVKIESRRLEWNVGSKVGSTNNIKHRPGGGKVQIHNERVEFRVGSRIGSLKNVKHIPGGGDKKIFDDKEYLKQIGDVGLMTRSGSSSLTGSTHWDSSTIVDDRNAPKTLNLTLPKTKKSFSSPGSSYQSQILRKLSPMSSGF